jgi:hypothetical protein
MFLFTKLLRISICTKSTNRCIIAAVFCSECEFHSGAWKLFTRHTGSKLYQMRLDTRRTNEMYREFYREAALLLL